MVCNPVTGRRCDVVGLSIRSRGSQATAVSSDAADAVRVLVLPGVVPVQALPRHRPPSFSRHPTHSSMLMTMLLLVMLLLQLRLLLLLSLSPLLHRSEVHVTCFCVHAGFSANPSISSAVCDTE